MIRRISQSNHKTSYLDNTGGKSAPKEVSGIIIALKSQAEVRLIPLLANIEQNSKIQFEVLDAVDGNLIENKTGMCNGAYGCVLSHIEAINRAKEQKLPAILIVEDDAIICGDFDNRLKEVLQKAGEGWDGIWLGGIDGETNVSHNSELNITFGSWSTYGYILRETVYDYCISGLNSMRTTCDNWYRQYLHPKYLCYKTKQELVSHRAELPSMVNPGKDWTQHPFGGAIRGKMSLTTKVIT